MSAPMDEVAKCRRPRYIEAIGRGHGEHARVLILTAFSISHVPVSVERAAARS